MESRAKKSDIVTLRSDAADLELQPGELDK
jgi:hypothetical protein